MTESNDPEFIAHRIKARDMVEREEAIKGPTIGGPREGMGLAEFCDEVSYGAFKMSNKAPRLDHIVATYPIVSLLSVVLESDIIRWMRANPTAVEAIMRGAKK